MMIGWYDVTDVAALLKVSPRTVQRWCRERRVPHVRVGRGIRFTAEQLAEIESVYSRARALSPASVDAPNPGYRHVTVVPMKRRPAA
jgi:excisionase family DNA binding protein